MSLTNHPLDVAVDEFDTAHRALARAFMNTGNTIDEVERAALAVVEAAHGIVREYRERQVAGDSFTRNGNTERTRRLMQDAGFGVIDLDAERRKRGANVIAFPSRQDAG